MASALGVVALLCIVETLVAGTLVRRHGRVITALGPYIEFALPFMLAIIASGSVLFRVATGSLGERA